MNLQDLRYFNGLSQELHFGRTAARLNVTQPTLSEAIRRLERELGAPLFERGPRRVSLTAEGRRFLPHAVAALDRLRAGVEEMRDPSAPLRGTVRLGLIPTLCPYVAPGLVLRLQKEAPGLSIVLTEQTTADVLRGLKEDRLDLGVLSTPVREKGVAQRAAAREPFLAAVGRSHRLGGRARLSLKDLVHEKLLILKQGHCFGDQALEFCKRDRRDAGVIFEGDSLASVLRLVESGYGVTLVPRMAADRRAYPRLRFAEIAESPSRELGVAWRITDALDRARRFVLETVEDELKKKNRPGA